MNGYLVPANSKKGNLILNMFRPIDLAMFAIGIVVTLILLMIVPSDNMVAILISILPAGVAGLLVIPIPNYHNVLCAIQSIFRYVSERRNYIWRGWCFYERFGKEEKK